MIKHRRMIIENRTNMSDLDALYYVERVVREGRISNDDKQYCYATRFEDTSNGLRVIVYTQLNKKSDRFVIIYDKHKERLDHE